MTPTHDIPAPASTESSVRVGLSLPCRTRPAPLGHDTILRIAEFADAQAGWDTLWVPDSVLALPYYDSGVLLAALAARTRRIRLGTACLASLGFRHPLTVARQWADLDALSGGRMTLVACPGNASGAAVERELQAFRMTYQQKVARFEESVEFLRVVSASEAASFHGTYLDIDDLRLTPGFVQRPLPIWLAANPSPAAGPKTIERVLGRVARLGAGWMTYNITPDLLRRRVSALRELRAAAATAPAAPDPFPVCVFLNANVAATAQQARADAAARWAQQSVRNISADDLGPISAIGTPAQAADFIARLVEAGATHLAIEVLSTRPEEQVHRLTDLLLPRLAGTVPRPGPVPLPSRATLPGTAR